MTKAKTKSLLQGRTAIIAGNGVLPVAVAKAIEDMGQKPYLIPLQGEADASLYAYEHCEISIVQLARLIKALKTAKISNIVLAGGVKSRPNIAQLRFDFTTICAIPKLLKALGQGDDVLLKAFIKVIETYGFKVVGAHKVVPQLLAPLDFNLTKCRASDTNKKDIALAAHAARILGQLDIGQGAVAVKGRVVAVEGAEGTDHMLRRIREMREEKRIPAKGGVLVKRVKPQQDERADLPTIGPETIKQAYESGLDGVAIEAEKSFILSLKETVEDADKYTIFIETFGKNEHV